MSGRKDQEIYTVRKYKRVTENVEVFCGEKCFIEDSVNLQHQVSDLDPTNKTISFGECVLCQDSVEVGDYAKESIIFIPRKGQKSKSKKFPASINIFSEI